MGCFLSCFKGMQRSNRGWEKESQGKALPPILNSATNNFQVDQNINKNESFMDGVNFAIADESESQEDLVYQEAIRSLMSRNDSNRENEEDENSLSGE